MTHRAKYSILNVLVAVILLSCVSQSVPDQRIADSRALSPPTVGVTLANPAQFTFAAVGDLHVRGGDTGRFRSILAAAAAEGDAFIVLLGDLVDTGWRDDLIAVNQAITDLGWQGKVFSVIGNHDVFDAGWTNFKDLIGPSFYTFTVGNSKFIVLDTADGTLGGDQMSWLEDEMKKTRPDNLFLLSHYLPVIPGQRTYLKLSNQNEALHLMKLALNHGVAAWLGAHYHSYITSTIDGVLYVVAGGGGNVRMPPVLDYFFVQMTVSGTNVSAQMHAVP